MKKFIVALAAVAMMATSAYAAEWNFYGSASVDTFWTDTDVINATGPDAGYQVGVENITSANVIGANVKVSDELTARFEYANGGAADNVSLRHLYGTWNFGAGALTVGRTDGAFDTSISSQVYGDDGMGDTGNADTGRADLVMLTFGGFKINIEAPNTDVAAASTGTATNEAILPQINASYKFNIESIEIEVGGAYSTFEYNDAVDINSYVIGASADGNFGACHLAATLFFGQNAGNLVGIDTGADQGLAVASATTVLDNDVFGYQVVAGYVVNDMFALEAGYGHVEEDIDGGIPSNDAENYYVQAPITLAPGVTVTPEVGVYDYNEAGENDVTYFGAAWKITF